MDFRILGDLAVSANELEITITAPKQRTVLAALLLNAGNEVPMDRLARYVWDDSPPAAAQTTVHSYIYRLRRLLRPLPVELSTARDSYRLTVGPGAIDLSHFKRRVSGAREYAQAGRIRWSVAELRSALELWRGDALAGVPGELIRQEARLLEAERIAAQEELFAAEVALGNHRKIISELQKIVTDNPFHESLRGLLILSLYCSDRQVEALQQFAQLERRLRTEVGINPGQALQELHTAILRQHPAEEIIRSFGPYIPRPGTPVPLTVRG